MWEDFVYLGIWASVGEVVVGNRDGVWSTRTFSEADSEGTWDRTNLKVNVAVPWRQNEDDAKMDGHRFKKKS